MKPTTDKDEALSLAQSYRINERYEESLSRGPGRFKVRFFVKEVDPNTKLPKITKAGEKKLVSFMKANYEDWLKDLKDEYKYLMEG